MERTQRERATYAVKEKEKYRRFQGSKWDSSKSTGGMIRTKKEEFYFFTKTGGGKSS